VVLEQIAGAYADIAAQKGIRLDIEPKLTTAKFDSDEKSLLTILRNLVGNAIKFCGKGGRIAVEVKETDRGFLVFTVTDNGIGMRPEDVAAFTNNEKVESCPGLSGEKGSGLGLDLVRNIVRSLRGNINLTSEPGKGTTFTISLPVSSDYASPKKGEAA